MIQIFQWPNGQMTQMVNGQLAIWPSGPNDQMAKWSNMPYGQLAQMANCPKSPNYPKGKMAKIAK